MEREEGRGAGPPVAEIYGWDTLQHPKYQGPDSQGMWEHGPTVTFNLLRPDGSYVGFEEVGIKTVWVGSVWTSNGMSDNGPKNGLKIQKKIG